MIGLISGSGTEHWPGIDRKRTAHVSTPYGDVEVTTGALAGVEVAHVSRHGAGHVRLSNHVPHRANIAALRDVGVEAVLSFTVCGAVDPAIALSSAMVFDDLYFPSNRLPDGTLCTFFDTPGDPERGHWIFERPFSEPLRMALLYAGRELGLPVVPGGCYGHVDGPRFNSRAEIAALRSAGVAAVSQTGGPEVVLAGEAELPFALVGFVTDYANGVGAELQPVDDLLARVEESTEVLASLVARALTAIADLLPAPSELILRFDP